MPFKLNEAPNLVLSKLNSHKIARDCGTFWSILFCAPTFGMSIDLCGDQKKDSEFKGLYPRSLSPEKKGSLSAIIESLRDLKITDVQLKKQAEKDKNAIIKQVQSTILILEEAIKIDLPQGYKDAIKAAYDQIKTKAKVEQDIRFAANLEKEPLITGHDFETPKYFTMEK